MGSEVIIKDIIDHIRDGASGDDITTSAEGTITFTQTFGSTDPRTSCATFAGDFTYASSTGRFIITMR